MNTQTTLRTRTIAHSALAAAALTAALLASGCKTTVDDATLTKNVQSTLAADSVIGQQPIQVATQNGIVTLSGNVSDDTASSLAAQDAAKVTGVKEVANDLTVAGMAVAPTITSPSAPQAPRIATPTEQTAIQQHQPLPEPPPVSSAPPPPAVHTVTVQSGRDVSIRVNESFDSQTAQPGTPFTGVVTRPIIVDGYIAIPTGAAVRGTLTDAKDATHFKGSSLLALRLNSIRHEGQWMQVSSDPYVVQGKGRGANTAEKIGGGAAIGAVLGGIFGGGKGAAIGAGAGAGGGTLLQGTTRGQQVYITSESVIPFRLISPLTVQTSRVAGPDSPNAPGLQTR